MITNAYLLTAETLIDVESLAGIKLTPGVSIESRLRTVLTVSSLLHNVLISVNRACSVTLSMYYDRIWTRRVIISSVSIVWMLNFAIRIPLYFVDFNVWISIYNYIQIIATYPSLAIYAVAAVWMLICGTHKVRDVTKRIFLYCLFSFLPSCWSCHPSGRSSPSTCSYGSALTVGC